MNQNTKIVVLSLVCCLFVLGAGTKKFAAAEQLSSKEEVRQFAKKAFDAQISLSEKERNLREIELILAPYFTDTYADLFLQKNLVGESNHYQTYGSDFAPYYIPFFSFSDKTKVDFEGKEVYMYELFEPKAESPLAYESRYEGLIIRQEKGSWKIAERWENDEIRAYIEQKQVEERENSYWISYLSTLVFYPDQSVPAPYSDTESKRTPKGLFYF